MRHALTAVKPAAALMRLAMQPILQKSILQAIQDGQWDYEPPELGSGHYDSTGALPGSDEKLAILAQRAQKGLPLWHEEDRRSYDDRPEA